MHLQTLTHYYTKTLWRKRKKNKNIYERATQHTLASSSARDVGSSCPPLFPTFLNDMLALSVPLPSSSEPHPVTQTAISPPKTTQHKTEHTISKPFQHKKPQYSPRQNLHSPCKPRELTPSHTLSPREASERAHIP